MKISLIIPVLNEQDTIGKLIDYLLTHTTITTEIIVVDGGSEDQTMEIVKSKAVSLYKSEKGRAIQMNVGAKHALGNILYFVHADTRPPDTFCEDIQKAVDSGFLIGSYRFLFDSKKILLKINSFLTRLPFLVCRGGDQTLFITKDLFTKLNGFDQRFVIMEEYDLLKRAKKYSKFKLFKKATIVSARKYEKNSWLKVQTANFKAFRAFQKGLDSKLILEQYKKDLK